MSPFATYPSLRSAVVLVTGGASGIGEAIVRAFAAQGSRTGFVDLDEGRGRALADELGGQGAEVRFEPCDLRDVDQLRRAFAALEAALGPATVLVNNAARDDRHGWEGVTPEYYDERIAANLRHMFFAIQAVAPGMIAAGKGSIINMGSNSWWQAAGGMPVYTTAKAAVHGMTRSFARDLGPHRIRVNTVVPGWVMTERQKALWVTPEKLERQPGAAVPAGPDRAGPPGADGAVPGLGRRGDVHGQQLHGRGRLDLRPARRAAASLGQASQPRQWTCRRRRTGTSPRTGEGWSSEGDSARGMRLRAPVVRSIRPWEMGAPRVAATGVPVPEGHTAGLPQSGRTPIGRGRSRRRQHRCRCRDRPRPAPPGPGREAAGERRRRAGRRGDRTAESLSRRRGRLVGGAEIT
jgi:NAD(P)-dependent dehydrogenase (short-subunit alcohol dehydrogenase family)